MKPDPPTQGPLSVLVAGVDATVEGIQHLRASIHLLWWRNCRDFGRCDG